jgi:small GTP-binding protein
MSVISKKICLVGDFGVGKTSLIRRFVERQFSDQYLSTVGVKISRKTLHSPLGSQESQTLQLIIWDIEGDTKFKAIAPSYLQGAGGAILVGDVSRPETIDHLITHTQTFLKINPNSWVTIALNKADLAEPEKLEKFLSLVESNPQDRVLATQATSAKTGDCVDLLFQVLAKKLIE